MEIIKYWICLFLIANSACSPLMKQNLVGTYIQEADQNTLIILNDQNFVMKTRSGFPDGRYGCCDTITYGSWKWLNNPKCLELDNSLIFGPITEIQVMEAKKGSNDSIMIHITNPIEQSLGPYHPRDVSYEVAIAYSNARVQGALYGHNIIHLPNLRHDKVTQIYIYIHPQYNFTGRNVGERYVTTSVYKVKDLEANFFQIQMPYLTYQYMTYLRLNKDYVRVINAKRLEWNGAFYNKL